MDIQSKKVYLFANWKMYLDDAESRQLAAELAAAAPTFPPSAETAVFPSALSFTAVAETLRGTSLRVGAQNVYWVDKGGYTGEVSAEMYARAGARYALAGHSERRHVFKETNHEVRQKIESILSAGLTPILCVGETMAERQDGKTKEVVDIQIRSALEGVSWPEDRPLFVAYEPVWAISKGAAESQAGLYCDVREAEQIAALTKQIVAAGGKAPEPLLIFGGSVRPDTVADYIASSYIDGVLVGAASTRLDSWLAIVTTAGAAWA